MNDRRSWFDDLETWRHSVVSLDRWREPRELSSAGPEATGVDGRRLVNFASNDYLGLADHPVVLQAAVSAAREFGFGAGSARLITGARRIHRQLEEELADYAGTDAAVLFPTGYMANVGLLSTLIQLGGASTNVFSDELNHASIIDGIRLGRAKPTIYPHADAAALDTEVASARPPGPSLIVSDSIFSMDGDAADATALDAVAAFHRALLVLDEAHEVFPLARPAGRGAHVIRVGTLSKTLGSLGGFVAANQSIVELLVNVARPYIFTTATPPPVAAAALAALRIRRSAEGTERVSHLRLLVDRFVVDHPSPIVAIVVGAEADATAASLRLRELGFLAPAIRPPTVAPGTSRLRITLTADHTVEHVDRLSEALGTLRLL